MTQDTQKLIREFLEHLKTKKQRRKKTIENYTWYLKRFSTWIKRKKVRSLTPSDMVRYREWLARLVDVHGEPLKQSTQNYHMIALRSFGRYLASRGIPAAALLTIQLEKLPPRAVTRLTPSELERILVAPKRAETRAAPIIRLRDEAILSLLAETGLRVSEFATLTKQALSHDKKTLRIGGQKPRTYPIDPFTRERLTSYLAERRDRAAALFVSHDKRSESARHSARRGSEDVPRETKPLTARSLQRIVQHYTKAAGILKPVTPHTMREAYARNLLAAGVALETAQTLLGHESKASTVHYQNLPTKKKKVSKPPRH